MTSELKPCKLCNTTGVILELGRFDAKVCPACQSARLAHCVNNHQRDTKDVESQYSQNSAYKTDTLAGLVRYELHWHDFDTAGMETDSEGEYVLYSDAAAVIAAKDAEIEKLKDGGHESFKSAVGWQERAKAAEAELAQTVLRPMDTAPTGDDALLPHRVEIHEGSWFIVQGTNGKPAGWADAHALFAHQVYRDQILPYTAPVASDAELKAENERLREALERIERGETTIFYHERQRVLEVSIDEDEMSGIAHAALKGDSNDKG